MGPLMLYILLPLFPALISGLGVVSKLGIPPEEEGAPIHTWVQKDPAYPRSGDYYRLACLFSKSSKDFTVKLMFKDIVLERLQVTRFDENLLKSIVVFRPESSGAHVVRYNMVKGSRPKCVLRTYSFAAAGFQTTDEDCGNRSALMSQFVSKVIPRRAWQWDEQNNKMRLPGKVYGAVVKVGLQAKANHGLKLHTWRNHLSGYTLTISQATQSSSDPLEDSSQAPAVSPTPQAPQTSTDPVEESSQTPAVSTIRQEPQTSTNPVEESSQTHAVSPTPQAPQSSTDPGEESSQKPAVSTIREAPQASTDPGEDSSKTPAVVPQTEDKVVYYATVRYQGAVLDTLEVVSLGQDLLGSVMVKGIEEGKHVLQYYKSDGQCVRILYLLTLEDHPSGERKYQDIVKEPNPQSCKIIISRKLSNTAHTMLKSYDAENGWIWEEEREKMETTKTNNA